MSALKFDVLDLIREPDNYTSGERARAAQVIVELIERNRVRSMEVEHLGKALRRAIELLAAIHMRCAPDDITTPDGKVMRFVPPDPEFYWRELSAKVRSVEAELRAIHDAQDATALARFGGAK